MRTLRTLLLAALLAFGLSLDVAATGGGGLVRHDHSAANKGGASLSGTTIASPTLSGTVAGTPTASGAWTFTATDNTFSTALAGFAPIIVNSSDAGAATGPILSIRRSSASPASNDAIGQLRFEGKDSGGNTLAYAYGQANILDPTDGSEDGRLDFYTVVAGTEAARVSIGQGMYVGVPTGLDKGPGTLNTASTIYQNNDPVATLAGSQTLSATTLSSPQFTGTITGSPTASGAWTFSNTGTPISVAGTLSSTKACASGYSRVAPNYCARTGAAVTQTFTVTTCQQTTALSGVSDAKAVYWVASGQITSNNAAGAARLNRLDGYDSGDSTCATSAVNVLCGTFEFSATAAGTTIGRCTGAIILPSTSTGQTRIKATALSATNAAFDLTVGGYFD